MVMNPSTKGHIVHVTPVSFDDFDERSLGEMKNYEIIVIGFRDGAATTSTYQALMQFIALLNTSIWVTVNETKVILISETLFHEKKHLNRHSHLHNQLHLQDRTHLQNQMH